MATLAQVLGEHTREGELFERLDGNWVRCYACAHCCKIADGRDGICKVRFNRGGSLMVPWGYVSGLHCDPIEKKPFFHAFPGGSAYSFGMLGCDLHCSFCQNWVTSQALRDPEAVSSAFEITPAEIVRDALRQGADAIVSTYNEPLITTEWAVAIFRQAKEAGLATGYVSNGNATPQVLDYLLPWLDLFKIDLKSFNDRRYRELGGRLQPVLETIPAVHRSGTWMEIVTLLVPGFNDSREELAGLTGFLASVSPDIPWHVTAFHPDYKSTGTPRTTIDMLLQAVELGRRAGLRFIYAGNISGAVGDLENTRCPSCAKVLVRRAGFTVRENHITPAGNCPACHYAVPGRWVRKSSRNSSS
jgi:pyruvate formate lyase activating enzyme